MKHSPPIRTAYQVNNLRAVRCGGLVTAENPSDLSLHIEIGKAMIFWYLTKRYRARFLPLLISKNRKVASPPIVEISIELQPIS